ncbi:MAG: hypothetical protein UR93_C0021G0008 [Berkelbacteria bacterium GW2011_GWA2_35_9]|uniref:Uncharacterized protein n=1 Tax=Berkelbacteria bacterium GW2011_GWA2_35_9 TaxID=1618333 RepID=A0A0G0DH70_9BACT|nr:MAG: hypothetical protein UR93_C0021G0008 [Berkelbacteria bacterium GW2011_GWA2_35_9]
MSEYLDNNNNIECDNKLKEKHEGHLLLIDKVLVSVEENVEVLDKVCKIIEAAPIPSYPYDLEKENYLISNLKEQIEGTNLKTLSFEKLRTFRSEIFTIVQFARENDKKDLIDRVVANIRPSNGKALDLDDFEKSEITIYPYAIGVTVSPEIYEKYFGNSSSGRQFNGSPYFMIKDGIKGVNGIVQHEKTHVLYDILQTNQDYFKGIEGLFHQLDVQTDAREINKLKRNIEKSFFLRVQSEVVADVEKFRGETVQKRVREEVLIAMFGESSDHIYSTISPEKRLKGLIQGRPEEIRKWGENILLINENIKSSIREFIRLASENNKEREATLTLAIIPYAKCQRFLPYLSNRWFGKTKPRVGSIVERPSLSSEDVRGTIFFDYMKFCSLRNKMMTGGFEGFWKLYRFTSRTAKDYGFDSKTIIARSANYLVNILLDYVDYGNISQTLRMEAEEEYIKPLLDSGDDGLIDAVRINLIARCELEFDAIQANNISIVANQEWLFARLGINIQKKYT